MAQEAGRDSAQLFVMETLRRTQNRIEQGKIIREELLDALDLQKSMNAKIGTIALEGNYLTQEQIDSILNTLTL